MTAGDPPQRNSISCVMKLITLGLRNFRKMAMVQL